MCVFVNNMTAPIFTCIYLHAASGRRWRDVSGWVGDGREAADGPMAQSDGLPAVDSDSAWRRHCLGHQPAIPQPSRTDDRRTAFSVQVGIDPQLVET